MSCLPVRLGVRYYFDYMGSSEFEQGMLGETIRRMVDHLETGEFVIDGIRIYAVWDTDNYDAAGVELVLNQLYQGQRRTKEWTNFEGRKYQEQKALEKQRRELRGLYPTNAWFVIDHGLFWTWEKINIKDIPLNLAKTVQWNDLTPEEQRAASVPAVQQKPTLEAKFGPLREQLIKSGQLKPR